MRKNIFFLFLLLGFLALFSCKDGVADQSEGVIEYDVSYPKMDKTNFMLDFMPKEMKMYFKDNKYITTVSAGMGTFKTEFLCDKATDEFFQLVKLINKKYVLRLEGEQIPKTLEMLPAYRIEFVDEYKEILGYTCKKAIVTVDNETNDAFSVYYTDQIKIENPNWCNQFAPIKGVMLEYQYDKYDICMRFEAKKINFEKVKDKIFEVPKDYQSVSFDEMEKEMTEIFESFK